MTVLEAIWLVTINSIAWLFLHFGISTLCLKIPINYFLRNQRFYRMASWEEDGEIWNRLFLVKKWKKHLIDGSSIVKRPIINSIYTE